MKLKTHVSQFSDFGIWFGTHGLIASKQGILYFGESLYLLVVRILFMDMFHISHFCF